MKIRKLFAAFSKNSLGVNDSPSVQVPPGFTSIGETESSDVFLVGFPKSGNTWLQNLVAGIQFGMDTRYLTDQLTQLVVPNVHGNGFYKRVSKVTCFKSHFLPRPEYRRVVYLVRDGRDALVSYFHMNNAVLDTPVSMAEMVVDGVGLFPCSWSEHVQQWMENPFGAEILTIRYEDLIQQPLLEMRRFCEFVDLDRSDELLMKSIAGNRFDEMQMKEKKFGWDNPKWSPEHAFVRRGQVGSFRDEMSEDLINRFERASRKELNLFSYELVGNRKHELSNNEV